MPVDSARTVWETCSEDLRQSLSAGAWMGFIQPLAPLAMDGDQLRLSAPSLLVKERVDLEYRDAILDSLARAAGRPVRMAVAVDAPPDNGHPEPPPIPASPPNLEALPPGKLGPGGLDPDHTFDSFVTSHTNRFAAAAAMSVAEKPAKSYNPLYIYGGVGLGKTHLLHAIGHLVRKLWPKLSVKYVSTEVFTNNFIQSIRVGDPDSFKRSYRHHDVLLVDDIQFLERKEQTQEEFFHTFNSLRERGAQIVMTSDVPPKALGTLEDRLRTRFESGLTADIQPPDFETRMAILRYKSDKLDQPMPDEVLSYIAHRVEDNIRELEGALNRIHAYATLYGPSVTVELATKVLADLLPTRGPRRSALDPGAIVAACADHFGMSTAAVLARSRTRPLVMARHVAMYLCRELTDLSLVEIGKAFGRDHTTVMYALEKVEELMTSRPQVYESVQTITHVLNRRG